MVRLMPTQARELAETILKLADGDESKLPQSVMDTLRKVAEQIASPGHGNDLVETVASLLLDTSSLSPVLGGSRLILLREAVLTPSELAKVRAVTAKACCSNCSADLYNGDMVSVMGKSIVCHRCAMPEQITCKCGMAHALPNLYKTVERIHAKCEGCAAGNKRPVRDDAANELNEPLYGGGRQVVVGRAQQNRPAVRPNWQTVAPPPMTAREREFYYTTAGRIQDVAAVPTPPQFIGNDVDGDQGGGNL